MLQQSLLNKIKQYLIRNRYSRNFRKFVQFLCCIVVFVTTYALILPAITMEQETFCGKEEHTHSELCQQPSQMKNLICTPEKLEIHVHFEDCYDEEGTLTCGQADYIVHGHDASCYDAFGQLVCILPERSAHIHGEDCYAPAETLPEVLHVHAETCNIQEKGELICLQEEREEHFHKEQCYEAGNVLECLLTENHVHDESCYSPSLSCTLSTEPHVHQDDCYEAGDLCCGILEGHVHTDDCKQEELTCLRSEGGHQHTNGCWETVQICENVDETHTHGDDCVRTDLVCGLTEEQHYHDGSCYSVSIHCDIPENHMHGQGCYEAVKVCGKEAGETHEHATECYGGAPQLQCQQPENHTHGSECFNQILICDLPEDPGHIHEDPCYLWNSVLNCGLEEGQPEPTEPAEPVLVCMEPEAPVHVHDETCFEPVADNRVLVCEVEEEGHEHTDLCYGCPLEEHVHTLICYSDPEADVETSDIWEATFAHVSLSGHGPTDLVAIAESQLGYTESIRNYEVWEDNSIHGYTRYGDWYGSPYGDWCAMFVSFCLNYADVDGVPQHWGVRPWISELSARGLYYSAKETKPQKGNLIFFDWERDGLADHVGIVADVQEAQEHTGASVKAIEGNSSDCVRYVYYSPDDPVILGYGLLPGQERIPVVKDPVAEEETPATYYCSLEEHTHSDDCYDEEGNLLCQLTEHSHTENCLEEPVIYGCGMEAHIHEGTCYNPAGELICGIDEHTHEDACRVNTTEVFIESSSESVVITYSAVHIEEVSPESAVVFRMYAASPMTVSEEDVSARTTAMDLNTYIAQYPNSTIRLKLLTMGNTVPEDNKIEIGKQYQLSLYFAVPGHGMEAGTYIYKLPEAFNYTVQTGKLYDSSKNVLLGEWTLYENGDLVFVFNEASNGYQDVAMTATIRTTVKEDVTQVDFDGNIFVVIAPTDGQEKETEITKFGTGLVMQNGVWVESQANFKRIKWTAVFTPGTNGLQPGTFVKDTLTSDLHYFSDEDKMAGISIGYSDGGGEWHLITVPGDSITWNGTNGFEFALPDINCQFCGNKFQFYEDREYFLTYYTTVKDNLPDGYHIHQNDIILDGETASGSIGLQIGAPSAYIVKSGHLDATTQDFKWNIQVKLPAYNGGQAYHVSITDADVIVDTSSGWDVKQNFTFSKDKFESVTAEVDGQIITVHHISEVTAQDEFCYTFTSENGIFIGHRCECTENTCAYWIPETHMYCDYWWPIIPEEQPAGTGGHFCTCWTYDKDVVFNFNMVYDGEEIIKKHGGQGLYFINEASLQMHYLDDSGKQQTVLGVSSRDTVSIPGMFGKHVIAPGPNSGNNYTASFEITVNDSKTDLSQLGGEGTSTDITIVDEMSSSLYYVRGTMVITQVDVYDLRTVLNYGIDYDMTVNGHTLEIDIHNPGPYQYILDYDAQLIVNTSSGQEPAYENHASVYIGAKTYHASTEKSYVTDYSYTADRYSVTMLKTSAESGQPLPGAVFGLFAESGLEIARGTTDTNGNISFETDLLENIVFRLHMPYYLQEISAPEGYILDDSKHWFYFSNHENTNGNKDPCAECTKLNNTYEDIIEIEKTNIDHDRIVDITVTNSMWGYELPATGGVGREVYAVGGWLLILAAGILLYNQKSAERRTTNLPDAHAHLILKKKELKAMKTMKKIASLLLALAMIFALATTAFAQEVDSEQNGPASITIQNASKGVTYNVVKLFDATVVGESISYNGNIPGTLSQYFEKDSGNNILFKQGADEANAFTAMKTWAATQNPTATAKSDGGELTFKNLEYGYYVITTATGTAVTVDSTKPNATVYDKNAYTVGIVKTVDDADVYIGQTVNYTLTATTSNYLGQGENAQLVTEYVITDTLPEFLINVEVTEITIGGEAYTVNDEVPQFENKKITIPWVDDTTQTSLYDNGAQIVVKYSATVTNSTVIDGKGNKNEVTLSANGNSWKDDEVIFTYAAALQKVDQNKKPLAGAKFSAKGLTAEKLSDGVYRVVSYDPNGDFGTEMETDAQGQLVILGLASDNKLTVKETVAPAGYNILVGTVEMTPVKTSEEITATDQTIYYDANGNVTGTQTNTSVTKNTYNVNLLKTAIVVINQAGTELPSTGGMGTTLFYVLGGILVAVAVVLLVTKKRMASNN